MDMAAGYILPHVATIKMRERQRERDKERKKTLEKLNFIYEHEQQQQ